MSIDIKEISSYNNWTIEQTEKIIFEYERFLQMKSINNDIIVPEQIEKMWKYHCLNTEFYYNYCTQKFNKILNYSTNQNKQDNNILLNIIQTIEIYQKTFGKIINQDIWNYSININQDNINSLKNNNLLFTNNQMSNNNNIFNQQVTNPQQNSLIGINNSLATNNNQNIPLTTNNNQNIPLTTNNNLNIPKYNENKPIIKTNIKIFIKYLNQNNPGPYNLQAIDYVVQQTDTFGSIKEIICANINFAITQIKLIPHPEIMLKNFLLMSQGELISNINVSSKLLTCDFVIAEINN